MPKAVKFELTTPWATKRKHYKHVSINLIPEQYGYPAEEMWSDGDGRCTVTLRQSRAAVNVKQETSYENTRLGSSTATRSAPRRSVCGNTHGSWVLIEDFPSKRQSKWNGSTSTGNGALRSVSGNTHGSWVLIEDFPSPRSSKFGNKWSIRDINFYEDGGRVSDSEEWTMQSLPPDYFSISHDLAPAIMARRRAHSDSELPQLRRLNLRKTQRQITTSIVNWYIETGRFIETIQVDFDLGKEKYPTNMDETDGTKAIEKKKICTAGILDHRTIAKTITNTMKLYEARDGYVPQPQHQYYDNSSKKGKVLEKPHTCKDPQNNNIQCKHVKEPQNSRKTSHVHNPEKEMKKCHASTIHKNHVIKKRQKWKPIYNIESPYNLQNKNNLGHRKYSSSDEDVQRLDVDSTDMVPAALDADIEETTSVESTEKTVSNLVHYFSRLFGEKQKLQQEYKRYDSTDAKEVCKQSSDKLLHVSTDTNEHFVQIAKEANVNTQRYLSTATILVNQQEQADTHSEANKRTSEISLVPYTRSKMSNKNPASNAGTSHLCINGHSQQPIYCNGECSFKGNNDNIVTDMKHSKYQHYPSSVVPYTKQKKISQVDTSTQILTDLKSKQHQYRGKITSDCPGVCYGSAIDALRLVKHKSLSHVENQISNSEILYGQKKMQPSHSNLGLTYEHKKMQTSNSSLGFSSTTIPTDVDTKSKCDKSSQRTNVPVIAVPQRTSSMSSLSMPKQDTAAKKQSDTPVTTKKQLQKELHLCYDPSTPITERSEYCSASEDDQQHDADGYDQCKPRSNIREMLNQELQLYYDSISPITERSEYFSASEEDSYNDADLWYRSKPRNVIQDAVFEEHSSAMNNRQCADSKLYCKQYAARIAEDMGIGGGGGDLGDRETDKTITNDTQKFGDQKIEM